MAERSRGQLSEGEEESEREGQKGWDGMRGGGGNEIESEI